MTSPSIPLPALVTLRDLRRDDGPLLESLLAGMSLRSRFLRFHIPVPRLTASMRRSLLDVDGHDRIALVAEGPSGDPIGVARTIRDPERPEEAEVAFAVVDAWHRRGIGRLLVTELARRARAAGVCRLVAQVLPENAAALGLVRELFPVVLTRRDDDFLVLVAVLDDVCADLTMAELVADLQW